MSIAKEAMLKLQNGSDVRGIATEGVEGQHGQPDRRGRQPDRAGVRPVARAEEKRRKPSSPQDRRGARLARLRARAEGAGARGTRRAGRRRLRLRARVHPVDVHVDRLPRDAVRRRRHDHREPPALQPQRAQVFRRRTAGLESRDITDLLAHRRLPHARPGGPLQGAGGPRCSPSTRTACGKKSAWASARRTMSIRSRACMWWSTRATARAASLPSRCSPRWARTPRAASFSSRTAPFPNHIPNPENAAAMDAVRAATVENHADLGIIFDTDVDRMSAVLSRRLGGQPRRDHRDDGGHPRARLSGRDDRHRLGHLRPADRLSGKHAAPSGTTASNAATRTSSTSRSASTPQGVSCPLAIETSGHGALSENYYLDDGAYMAVKLLIAAARARREGKQDRRADRKAAPRVRDAGNTA